MLPGYLVSVFLITAGLSIILSPMPTWMRSLQAASFIYLGVIYAAVDRMMLSEERHSFLLRYGMVVLASVVLISISSWRFAGCKIWRKIKWK